MRRWGIYTLKAETSSGSMCERTGTDIVEDRDLRIAQIARLGLVDAMHNLICSNHQVANGLLQVAAEQLLLVLRLKRQPLDRPRFHEIAFWPGFQTR
jgi:hypothetical protein